MQKRFSDRHLRWYRGRRDRIGNVHLLLSQDVGRSRGQCPCRGGIAFNSGRSPGLGQSSIRSERKRIDRFIDFFLHLP